MRLLLAKSTDRFRTNINYNNFIYLTMLHNRISLIFINILFSFPLGTTIEQKQHEIFKFV